MAALARFRKLFKIKYTLFNRNVFICSFAFLFAGIIIRFALRRQNLFLKINDLHEKKIEQHIELVIGILSARENFEQRQAIRETWLTQKVFSENEDQWKNLPVKPWFILGSRSCGLPPTYRMSKYNCERWKTNASEIKEKFFTSSEVKDVPCHSKDFRVFHQGFSFQVHYPVLLTSLGIFSKVLYGNQSASIALLDLRTKDVLVKTIISSQDYDLEINGFLYNNVKTYLLPEGYEGLVLVEGHLLSSDCGSINWFNGAGVISFNRVYTSSEDIETYPYSRHLNVASSIGLSIHDFPLFMNIISSETSAVSSWQLSQKIISRKLKKEVKKWKDILFFDVIDTYRNIPSKLLQFYSWLSKFQRFSYLLKTDDDCMIDVSAVLQELKGNPDFNLSGVWWWSRFRSQWPVNYSGKWADYDYKSPIYPPFPCGGGYVLSRGIVNWIATNAHFLFPYQGEDASMGIWLAAVNPLYVKDERWQCDTFCTSKSFNRAQLTTEEMYSAWSMYHECGNMCSCNKTSPI